MPPPGCNLAGAHLTIHYLIWLLQAVVLCIFFSDSTDASNVEWMINAPSPLVLPPSAFSASSVHPTLPDSQAEKANMAVFSSPEETSGAWCPAHPVQSGFTEWLQVDFGEVKLMRILFTDGRGRNQPAYVPSFVIRYQRSDSQNWLSYRMLNGSQLLYTTQNLMTIAITLDPPIVAKRFRIYPYNELEPRNMCLRLAVYGSEYNDGVVNYTIPEGDTYRLDRDHRTITLNDTSYDGQWTQQNPFTETLGDPALVSSDRRAYLYGGLGLLVDKQFYQGSLLETRDGDRVVGWFRRRHSVPTSHVRLLFNFDQVRNFSEVRLHTLNSLDYVSVFRRVLVQFSVGGQYFDRSGPPVLTEIRRDTSGQQARWVPVSLGHRIGRSLRITLWFDYDWIVLSEVTFSSVPLSATQQDWLPEKPNDPVHPVPTSDFAGAELTKTLSQPDLSAPTSISPVVETLPVRPTLEEAVAQPRHSTQQYSASTSEEKSAVERKRLVYPATRPSSVSLNISSTPYLIAIVCSCLGLLLFTVLFAFMFCRFQRSRRDRMKKLHCGKTLTQHDCVKQSHQLHQFSPAMHSGNYFTTTAAAMSPAKAGQQFVGAVSPTDATFLAPKGVETSLLLGAMSASSSGGVPAQAQPYLDSVGHISQTYPLLDHMEALSSHQYKQLVGGVHPDSILALQLLQQSSNLNSTLPFGGLTMSYQNGVIGTLDSSATLARRYFPTGASYPLACMPPNFPNSSAGKRSVFRPPPPPDQPLPPLPVSGVSNSMLVQNYAKDTVSQNPPTAFCLPHYPTDTNGGFFVPFDGSMPEYASASIFSGSGTMQNSPGRSKSIASTNTYRPVASSEATDSTKFPGISETYCVPHQNSIHRHFGGTGGGGLWPIRNEHHHTNSGAPILAASETDRGTESLDSSGMYYFSNSQDQSTSNTIPTYGFNQRPLLHPFTSPSKLIPLHNFNLATCVNPQPKDATGPLLNQEFSQHEAADNSASVSQQQQPSFPRSGTSELTDFPHGDAPLPPARLSALYQNDDPHGCLVAGASEGASTPSASNQQGPPSTVHSGSSYKNCPVVA